MSARVTVVVPSFNQGRFLERALQSIFEQDVPVEVFVMDGGSTDESRSIIVPNSSGATLSGSIPPALTSFSITSG